MRSYANIPGNWKILLESFAFTGWVFGQMFPSGSTQLGDASFFLVAAFFGATCFLDAAACFATGTFAPASAVAAAVAGSRRCGAGSVGAGSLWSGAAGLAAESRGGSSSGGH